MPKILFNLEEETNKELKELAARWKTNKSQIIRYSICKLINQHKIRNWDPKDYTDWRNIEETIEIAKTKWLEEED